MANYSTDPQGYGRVREEEKQRMLQRFDTFYNYYENWNRVREAEIPVFEQLFRERLNNAFEHLQAMTVEILGCTDEELNAVTLAPHASSVIATVRATHEAFDFLRLAAETILSALCTESQQLFAQRTDLDKLKDDLQELIRRQSSEVVDVANEEATRWRWFTEAQVTVEDYERKIRDYDNLNIFEQLWTSNAHDQYGGVKNDAEQRRNARGWEHTHMRELKEWLVHQLEELTEAQIRVTRCSDEALGVENKVVNAKMAATEVFSKAYDLENYLTTRDIEFSVEEAVRHILQLLYTSVAVVDSDMQVKGFKALILGKVAQKYGVEKTEELKQSKKYLEYQII